MANKNHWDIPGEHCVAAAYISTPKIQVKVSAYDNYIQPLEEINKGPSQWKLIYDPDPNKPKRPVGEWFQATEEMKFIYFEKPRHDASEAFEELGV